MQHSIESITFLTGLHIEGSNIIHIKARELASRDVHDGADHAGRMGVSWWGEQTLDQGLVPLLAGCVQDIERVGSLALGILATKIYENEVPVRRVS